MFECMNAWINECIPANIFYEADLEFVYSSSPSLTGVTPKDVKVSRCQDVKMSRLKGMFPNLCSFTNIFCNIDWIQYYNQ